MQYVGQITQELHLRMNSHRSDYNAIRTGSKKSVTGDAKHKCCTEHDFGHFNVMVIEVHVNKPQSAASEERPTPLDNSEKR